WWPLTCRSRPSAMWRSPATSFVGYLPSGSTDPRWVGAERAHFSVRRIREGLALSRRQSASRQTSFEAWFRWVNASPQSRGSSFVGSDETVSRCQPYTFLERCSFCSVHSQSNPHAPRSRLL